MKITSIPRATRFPLKLRVRYRVSGTTPWNKGHTIDISRTGVLFQAEQDVGLRTVLEMRIAAPSFAKLTLVCHGHVIRKQEPDCPQARPVLAALIRTASLRRQLLAHNST
jgi:hypothetical protein